MNLQNYLWSYPSLLTSDEVEFINGKAMGYPLESGAVGQGGRLDLDPDGEDRGAERAAGGDGGKVVDNIRASDIRWIHKDAKKVLGDVWTKVEDAVAMGMKQSGWNVELEKLEPLQHTTYNAQQGQRGGFYTWHTDASDKPYANSGMIRKISFSIILNTDYIGGNFEFELGSPHEKNRNEVLTPKLGCAIVFPSFTFHRVTPVTEGTRYSLVGWICGKPYR